MVLLSMLALIELLNFYEKQKVFRKSRLARNNPLLLFVITLLALTAHIMSFLLWDVNWIYVPNGLDCNLLIQAGVVLLYVVIKQFIYLFLFERVKVVHDALHMKNRKLIAFRWVVFCFATIGIPVAMYPLIFLYFRGSVVIMQNGSVGVCVQHAINHAPAFLLAIADLTMSIILLGLFVMPLVGHIRNNVAADAKRLYFLAKRNTIVSLIMTLMTFLAMMFLAVYGVQPDPSQVQFLHQNTSVAQLSDILVCTLLAHTLSSGWLPTSIKKRLSGATVRSSKGSRTDPNASSKNTAPVTDSNQIKSKEVAVSVQSSSQSPETQLTISPGQVQPEGV